MVGGAAGAPARNDSAFVAVASRSYYPRLLNAGGHTDESTPGLLHAKTLCVDHQVCPIGSTNLDLRSFDLNFENNILLQDAQTTLAVRERQNSYIQQSHPVTLAYIQAWPWWLRIWNNLLATLSPVL
ncbi:MAG: phospholipase D-like domain-containing protein [Acidovorax sp.]|nr:phospholipase D-like domain-containing protein [Acidovorax sp.]